MRWPVSRLAKRGKWEANVGPAQFDLGDHGAEHRGLKAAPHSLDLRQFRHLESPNSRGESRAFFAACGC